MEDLRPAGPERRRNSLVRGSKEQTNGEGGSLGSKGNEKKVKKRNERVGTGQKKT